MNLAIFASGTGTNAARVIDYFRGSATIKVSLIVCNKPGAGVLDIAQREGVPGLIIEKEPFFRGGAYVDELKGAGIDLIVLAGFLWKIPLSLVKAFPEQDVAPITPSHEEVIPSSVGGAK